MREIINKEDAPDDIKNFISVYENLRIPIKILYFITFFCFTENYSISKTLMEAKAFCSEIDNFLFIDFKKLILVVAEI